MEMATGLRWQHSMRILEEESGVGQKRVSILVFPLIVQVTLSMLFTFLQLGNNSIAIL